MEKITARENQNIKRVVRLMGSKEARTESGQFVAEGLKLCAEALAGGVVINELYCTEALLKKHPQQLAALCEGARLCYLITDDIAGKLADTVTPQGVYAVCALPQNTLEENSLPKGRYLALDSLQDPGNLGTILRSADAFGIDAVILTDDCPDVFSPKVLRATMGSALRVKTCRTSGLAGLLKRLAPTHVTYAATLGENALSLGKCSLNGSVIVVVGSEARGISADVVNACNSSIIIDMHGGAESLNAAVAASIILWEMSK